MKNRTRKWFQMLLIGSLLLGLFSVDFSLQGTVSAANTTYYVDCFEGADSNSGTTTSSAWKTLSKVNGTTFSAGDQILLKSGCAWTGQLHPKGSGTSSSPIIIDQYGTGNKPIINGEGTVASSLYLYNQQYWEINNLEITNFGSTVGRRKGVHLVGENAGTLNHIYLKGLKVHNVNGDAKKDDDATGGIVTEVIGRTGVVTKFNDVKIENSTIYDVGRQGIVTWSSWAIISGGYGTRDTTNFDQAAFTNYVVQNNTLYNIDGDGVVAISTKGAIIQYNVAHDVNRWHYTTTINPSVAFWPWNSDNTIIQNNEAYNVRNTVDGQGFDSDYWSNNTIIQYNYSHDNEGGFLLICSLNSTMYNKWSIIRYNISENDGTAGNPIINLMGPGTTGTSIYNNSIYVPAGNASSKVIANANWGGNAGQTWIENNIFYIKNGTSLDDKSDWNYYNNLYYGVSKPSEDTVGIVANPHFVNVGTGGIGRNSVDGYKLLTSSPALSAGKVIGGNGGLDYYGNTVSATIAPNIGAYNGVGIVGELPEEVEPEIVLPATGYYYKLINRNSGKPIGVQDGSSSESAQIEQWSDGGWNSQHWLLVDAGGGYFKLQNRQTTKYLSISGASLANGAAVVQHSSGTGYEQQWSIVKSGTYLQLVNRGSGKVLDISDESTANGADAIQWTDTDGSNQQWQFVKVL
ncbi:RICIN domain-containing protein [Paenibacillus endoradicis]|uniref:RICIN domain-containing protein n=1 Tax=Paenibacillus endoradicis TaxID=2972487 RepID=UPI0021591939|nr:RICIN domain-containing protein [Paenibacillus endoradicis]MCR8657109.1 RICIN domain-containing protein [Paenibacillus endoradicis]